MMKTIVNMPDSFTVDDIRKLRDDFDRRYTDEDGNIDWEGATAKTEKGAAKVLAKISRIRAEKGINFK